MPALTNHVLLVLATVALVVAARRMRGTTLFAPCCWALGALIGLGSVEAIFAGALLHPSGISAWRFLAATGTLCPGIALLGAKRPQNRPWQWIVASLWLVLALPAIQFLVLRKGGVLDIHPARAWFMVGLTLFTVANSVLCRKWLAVLLAGCGQLALFSALIPFPFLGASSQTWPWGITLISLAAVGTTFRYRSRTTAPPLDRVWIDFRCLFGMVWSLRLMEQLNAVARSNGWDVTLVWSGFRSADGQSPLNLAPEQLRILQQSFQNLLRRFVTPEWIAERMGNEGCSRGTIR